MIVLVSIHYSFVVFYVAFFLCLGNPGLVIVCHITGTGLDKRQKSEMIRYLRSVQLEDGGWGL